MKYDRDKLECILNEVDELLQVAAEEAVEVYGEAIGQLENLYEMHLACYEELVGEEEEE